MMKVKVKVGHMMRWCNAIQRFSKRRPRGLK